MSRRSHKKSKNGCFECKKRHIRCDESHPVCVNCRTAEIRCSFLGSESPYIVHEPRSHNDVQSTSSPNTSTTPSTPVPTTSTVNDHHDSVDPYTVNMTHLQLFHNLSSEEFLSFEYSQQGSILSSNILTKYILPTPYLMHQVLAISALHLSTRNPTSCDFFRDQAAGLQNRALTLFNKSSPVIEVTSNYTPMFLFSSLVGSHLLCDTLHYQRQNFEWFIDRFTNCLNIYHGVITIVHQCWQLLHETELGPRLKQTADVMRPTDTPGSECAPLRDLVKLADVSPAFQTTYTESISQLQQVFDAQRGISGDRSGRALLSAWPIMVSPEYVDLLRQRRAEALIILAYYAVLLHRGRDTWLYGDGGLFLIESVCGRLEPKWQQWLEFPKAALSGESPN